MRSVRDVISARDVVLPMMRVGCSRGVRMGIWRDGEMERERGGWKEEGRGNEEVLVR